MTTAVEVNPRLKALTDAGVSIWLDQIRRSLIESGELARMVAEESLRGVTANPSIFEKAILGSTDYDDQLQVFAREQLDPTDIYERLAIRDVQEGADVLAAVHREAGGRDGFVSLEVAPQLAHDTEGTLEQVRSYWKRVDRPNLMIKIPGTPEGVPAIEQAIYEGINVNVTLLFSVDSYAQVAQAFIRGLERRKAEGKPTDVHSVASFFVSRVDTEVDKRLEKLGREDLRGLAGLANARAAYVRFARELRGPMEALGSIQRPLWASTGVKDPRYPDTMYVDQLVARDTVNTMPLDTLMAEAEHGEPKAGSGEHDPSEEMAKLAEAGIDIDDVTDQLLVEGIAKFITPMVKLMAGIESKREAIVTGRPRTFESNLPDEAEQQ